MQRNSKALISLHLSIFIAGFTGVFGRLIELESPLLSLYRTALAFFILAIYLYFYFKHHQDAFCLPLLIKLKALLVGAILFVHWVLFYASIQLSNISVGVVCLSAMGFFSSFLEPWLLKRKFELKNLGFSFLSLLGLLAIFHFDISFRLGIIVGIISSLCASLFTITNKTVSGKGDPKVLLGYEMAGALVTGFILVLAWAFIFNKSFKIERQLDLIYLICLASVCTIGLYLMQLNFLKDLSAFTVNLSYNLEPVYSIILAMIIFHEYQSLGVGFVLGLALIALSVGLQNLTLFRFRK